MSELLHVPLGDSTLQSGQTLRGASLAYVTHGTLHEDRGNAIVFPTHYGGTHLDNTWLIGPGKALDTDQYFIIVPNMLGNGVSSSPSNTPPPQQGPDFPRVTVLDNVALQQRLVTEVLGISRLQLVIGFSMGAQQTFQWAVSYPQMMERIIAIAGTACTSPHNWVFLEGVTAALKADAAWQEGRYTEPPLKGLRAMGRVWAGWGHSQAFWRAKAYRSAGYESMDDYIRAQWEEGFTHGDANDLLAMARTWQHADVGATPGFAGNTAAALAAIQARALIMPGATDLYFPPEDSAYEASLIPGAVLRPIPSIWGHTAGGGATPEAASYLETQIKAWLRR